MIIGILALSDCNIRRFYYKKILPLFYNKLNTTYVFWSATLNGLSILILILPDCLNCVQEAV